MSRDQVRWGILLLVVLSIGMSLLLDPRETASASALSVGSHGLFVARRYLEERGFDVRLIDRPLGEAEPGDVLVLAFPWQRWASGSEQAGVHQQLLRGGTVVLAYSGEESRGEQGALDWLGLSWEKLRGEPPLGFFAWRAYANEEWSLMPAENPGALPIRISALSHAPRAPADADVLYRGPSGEPLVFVFSYLRGRVVVLPSEVFSNARILEEGNADLLASLMASFGPAWSFDEFHHGLSAPLTKEQKRPRFAFDLFLLHLAMAYALVVWRLARSFGPVWSERPVSSGSTRTFLLGLGSLHDRLGHHGEAAELMVRRARELSPRMELAGAGTAKSGAELVDLGSRVARGQAK
ncbi:MAG: DUF4350 domain-containing protein [Vicinamibacteria bacterium]